MLRRFRNNRGSTIILFAFSMTMIMVCTALVLDFGRAVVRKSMLQNAIDAACLAGAMDLPDEAAAESAARQYFEANGHDRNQLSVSFGTSGSEISIGCTEHVQMMFAAVLGISTVDVGAAATASVEHLRGPFDYVLFSGSTSDTLRLNGSKQTVVGNAHSNQKFTINGSKITITGRCEAVSTLTINGSQLSVPYPLPNSDYVEMPDFSAEIRSQAEAAGQLYTGNRTFSGSTVSVDEPIYVDGNVTVNGSHFSGQGCILATGSITFNGSNLRASTDDAVCFYSKSGSITVNGSNAQLEGILYAPNGEITLNGSNQTVNGRIIGNKVTINGSTLTLAGSANDLLSLPKTYVKLTK